MPTQYVDYLLVGALSNSLLIGLCLAKLVWTANRHNVLAYGLLQVGRETGRVKKTMRKVRDIFVAV